MTSGGGHLGSNLWKIAGSEIRCEWFRPECPYLLTRISFRKRGKAPLEGILVLRIQPASCQTTAPPIEMLPTCSLSLSVWSSRCQVNVATRTPHESEGWLSPQMAFHQPRLLDNARGLKEEEKRVLWPLASRQHLSRKTTAPGGFLR